MTVVDDRVEHRIRKPADLLRFIVGCAGLALLVGVGFVARGTAAGIETDVLGAGKRLPGALLALLSVVAAAAVLLLAVAMAIEQITRRQFRMLVEAVLTGALSLGVVAAADAILLTSAAEEFRATLGTAPGSGPTSPLDAYLAALVAYVTVLGTGGRWRWPTWLGVAIGVEVLAALVARQTTVLAILLTLLVGRTIGVGVRYAAGLPSLRPSAAVVAAALAAAGEPVARMERRSDSASPEARRYVATTAAGRRLDVVVLDRDQQGAGALYRFYRKAWLSSEVSRRSPLSLEHALERQALMSYAFTAAGVPTPRLVACVPVGSDAAALAYEPIEGVTLASLDGALTDDQIRAVWRVVKQLHAQRVTHRALTANRVLLTPDGVALLEPGDGDVAATDLQVRLDVSQFLAETGLLVGPGRAAEAALDEFGPDELAGTIPLLQRVALQRSTGAALRRRRDVLPALREKLLAASPGPEPPPVRLERVRLRSLISLVAAMVGAYLLIGELGRVDLGRVLRSAHWGWAAVAALLSAATYLAAGASVVGFVAERLNYLRTVVAQVAASFVTLVTPAAVGGAALNIRYLQRAGVPPAAAAASIGVSQVIAFTLHFVLLLVFAAITGTGHGTSLQPPSWVWFVLAGLVVLAAAAIAVPAGRRLLRARLAPTLSQVLPRLLEVAQRPDKLIAGIGGALGLTAAYVTCLYVCVRALGGSVGFTAVAVVYLTGSALGSVVPTPGGLGTVEAALSAGLTAAGLDGATAVSAVLLFRLLTFWLPVPVGWVAFNFLQRRRAI